MWKCRPYGWLWGLPLLALLWLLVFFGVRPDVEKDLGERVTTALEEAGLGWAKADFVGRDGVLTGTADSAANRENAEELVEKTWGVREVDVRTQMLRKVKPYTWSASKEGRKLLLAGYVPKEQDREAVVTMAKSQFPEFVVEDQMKIAAGEPDQRTFMEGIGFGLQHLARLNTGKVVLSDNKFSIEGLTRDIPSFDATSTALKNELPAGIELASKKIRAPEPVVPLASPFVWSAHKEDKTLRLSGHVHDAAERSAILETARKELPDYNIEDNLQVARGKPAKDQWAQATTFGLSQLARLDRGTVNISDLDYTIKGKTEDAQTYNDLQEELKQLPAGFNLAGKEIETPVVDPYTWRADYHDGRVTLSGNAPDRAARDDIKARAASYFPKAQIIDNMEIGLGAPENWRAASDLSLRELAGFETGSASLWGQDIEMRGSVASEEKRSEIIGRMTSGIPAGYKFSDQIRAPKPLVEEKEEPKEVFAEPPKTADVEETELAASTPLEQDTCQTYLNSVLASEKIHFPVASAELTPQSFPVLTRLAHIANRCPDTRIEIAGYTDSDGGNNFNDFLSLRRARAVVAYLTEQGVEADRLSAVGYGKSRPLLPNTSEPNKAVNRRIEFVVKGF